MSYINNVYVIITSYINYVYNLTHTLKSVIQYLVLLTTGYICNLRYYQLSYKTIVCPLSVPY